MKKYQNRKEVPKNYQWDLNVFYKNNEDWEKDYHNIEQKQKELQKFQGKIKDGKSCEEFLKLDTEINATIDNLYVYAMLNHDTNLEDDTYFDLYNRSLALFTKYQSTISFFKPELLALTEQEFTNLFQEKPELTKYQILLEDIYSQKEHTLSESEEKIVSLLTENNDSYYNISSSLIHAEHHYGTLTLENKEKVTIASNNVRFLKQNKNPKIRKEAEKKFGETLKQYEKTESSLLNYYVKNNINLAKIRHYASPFDEYTKTHKIQKEVYQTLSETAKKNKKIYQKYFRLAKKALNLKTLHSYDLALPWTNLEKEYTIEEGEDLIRNALKPLGTKYLEKWEIAISDRAIDYAQYKGKKSGGYCCSTQTKPSRILMSFNGTLEDVSTIAHETGHYTHHAFISENNDIWYREVPNFTAEVASLTNEFLLSDYLLKNGTSNEEKRAGLENVIKVFRNNFFGAIIEGEMEFEMYEHVANGNTITAEYLNNLAKKQLDFYCGKTVKHNEYSYLMWVTRSHYYMNFYLYSYALCVSIASVVTKQILTSEDYQKQYYEFLKSGSNLKPEEIFQKLNVDITDEKTYQSAIDYFNTQLDYYEELLNKEGEGNE